MSIKAPMLNIYIGWDSKEPSAFAVLAHSILKRATVPVSITPLTRKSLEARKIYTRPRGATESTEFSLTRFLVPYLSNYEGFSVFMDCDMLMRVDIGDLWLHLLADPGKAVYVCPHDYVPRTETKFLGQQQTVYPRKNWSSFIVFDNSKCRALSPDYVNTASGLDLHRFNWCDVGIGSLPLDWNWLVGEYEPNPHAKNLHYTLGTPCFEDAVQDATAALWWDEYRDMLGTARAVERALETVNAVVGASV